MKCPYDPILIDDYINNQADENSKIEIEAHLKTCNICRARLNSVQSLRTKIKELTWKIEPESDLWLPIFNEMKGIKEDRKLEEDRKAEELIIKNTPTKQERKRKKLEEKLQRKPVRKNKRYFDKRIIFLSAFFVVAALLIYFFIFYSEPNVWRVIRIAGKPELQGDIIINSEYMESGESVSTNQISKAVIDISQIGEIYINPSTRLTRIDNNSCRLQYGSIRTFKEESGSLFTVEIPFGTVYDKKENTNYYIETAKGRNLIEVTSGRVFMEFDKNKFYVLPNFSIYYREGAGPGLPLSVTASPELKSSVEQYCFSGNKREALDRIMKFSQITDAPTIWNLLSVVPGEDKDRVFTKLYSLVTPPKGIEEAVYKMNDEMLLNWLDKIESEIKPLFNN